MEKLNKIGTLEKKVVAGLSDKICRLNPVLGVQKNSPYKKWRASVIAEAIKSDNIQSLVGWAIYNFCNESPSISPLPFDIDVEHKHGWFYTFLSDLVNAIKVMPEFEPLTEKEFKNFCSVVVSISVERTNSIEDCYEYITTLMFDTNQHFGIALDLVY
ncbi:MAG: hypothetical protein KatS3mg083_289 [Candidatus Dojkabacteria bacterium]|nr:MAG: hypothetical protein KatS3mg083_289 [Candidatus Dojkabacteria bacterium]